MSEYINIKLVSPVWKVEIHFKTPEEAAEFKKRLDKVRETGGSPLHNSLLASSLAKSINTVIVKEVSAV